MAGPNSMKFQLKMKFEKRIHFQDLIFEYKNYIKKIEKKNSKFLIHFLEKIKLMNLFQPINIRLYDHNKIYKYSIFNGLVESSNNAADVSMHSQSLAFIFKNGFGFDTLTVNGCFECSQESFSKLAKTFAIGSLNALGISLNLSLLFKPQVVFLFLFKLRKVLSKLV